MILTSTGFIPILPLISLLEYMTSIYAEKDERLTTRENETILH